MNKVHINKVLAEGVVSERYTVVEDPCGLFFIWDELLLEPAMMGDEILAFVRPDCADRIARVLNARANDEPSRRPIQPLASAPAVRRRVVSIDAVRAVSLQR
ncbi:MAG: hypothetical protein KF874_15455 [Rhizobiaceae bacterium]|nr:hypothetical protein [Rhizobiaceae bacterium]